MNKPIQAVILCGGSGTRLWPLSRKAYPKPFVPMVDNKCLLQLTIERLTTLNANGVWAVGAEDHRFLITECFSAAGCLGTVLLEPQARNTAAAIALAAVYAGLDGQDPMMLFCPADHHIPNVEAFLQSVQRGVAAADAGYVVTLGVLPTHPSTAYGYIKTGSAFSEHINLAQQFVEKPDATTATQLLLAGNCLWNAGIFLAKASVIREAMNAHAPDILSSCEQACAESQTEYTANNHRFVRPEAQAFERCRSESFDIAVMELNEKTAVVPFVGQWSDVGSWRAVADLHPADAAGNRVSGKGYLSHSINTFVCAPSRPVVALGVENLLIIDTPDALLVAHRDQAEAVKDVVSHLDQLGIEQAVMHRRVARPWGWYDTLETGARFQVKRIGVNPGASLSLQMHHHRAEHWIVVNGTAEVTCNDQVFLMTENQSTFIPLGATHRLKNPGLVELEMIEVQSGNYLGEDDIVRFEDTYGRAGTI